MIPTVCDVHDRDALSAALANVTARARAVQEIADLAARPEFAGVDLDLEHAGQAGRDAFTRFVQDVAAEVHARGKLLVVTVPGKRADGPSWIGYDYAALGAVADRFRIMTYGYSGTWTAYPGGPIAPTDWIERVLTYAVSVVPADRIDVGIPFYGYDWPADGSTIRSVTVPRARTLAGGATATAVEHVAARGESRFSYTDGNGVAHTVYTDAPDVAAKMTIAHRFGCRGIAIWALGYGDDAVWDALRVAKLATTP